MAPEYEPESLTLLSLVRHIFALTGSDVGDLAATPSDSLRSPDEFPLAETPSS